MKVLAAIWPFRPSRAEIDAEKLLATITQVARQPGFYGENRVPDSLQGRLELMMLHASLAFIRLRTDEGAAPLAQAFADKLFRQFDSGLREDGVGDLTVPKRMKTIARSFYGRLDAYAAGLKANDRGALTEAIARNVFRTAPTNAGFAPALAGYAAATVEKQASQATAALFDSDGWTLAPG